MAELFSKDHMKNSNDKIFGPRFRSPANDVATEDTNSRVFGKRYGNPLAPCSPEPVRSRQQPPGPQIFYATFQNPGPNAQADVQLILPFPCNSFFLSAVKGGTEASSIFLHLAPIGRIYSAAAIAALGTEGWISLNTNPSTGPNYRTVVRFDEKVLIVYFDIGVEGGAGPLTVACVADDSIQITGGLYT